MADFDLRQAPERKAPVLRGERGAASARLHAMVPGVKIELDELLESPKFIHTPHGFLTGPKGEGRGVGSAAVRALPDNEPDKPVKAFLNEHAALFGHEVLATARKERDYVTPHNALRTTVWQQELDGIPVFEAVLMAHVTARGELVNVSSQFLPDLEQAANAGRSRRGLLRNKPAVLAAQALVAGMEKLGRAVNLAEVRMADGEAADAEQRQSLEAPGVRGSAEARLVWLPMNRAVLRLCWQLTVTENTRGETFLLLVDAENGAVVLRRLLTIYASNASYRVFTSDGPSPFSPGHPGPSSVQPPLATRTLVTWPALDTNASPNGWINDGVNETRGNNVDAHTDRFGWDRPDLPRPQGSPYRVFDYPLDLADTPATYTNASVVQLFYWCNWMHDRLWALGFTEATGNFQNTNFGRGGLGNDALLADAQDGDGVNNANFTPTSDGTPPRIQMFLFTGPSPSRDGALDAEVVLHEYAHGLSTRLVGGGVGMYQPASRAMGEGWSDFYALALLSQPGDDPGGNYAMGGYASYLLAGLTNNYYFGIRRYPYSTNLARNPLTFKDIDPTQADPHVGVPRSPLPNPAADEVHNQGEVWCAILWEVRANLLAKHGFEGNELCLKLVTDGMKLVPANPNFVQARDAILQADEVLTGGANRNELWRGFAKRGLGYHATAPASSTVVGLRENFDLPDDLLITPLDGFLVGGPAGGPFSPMSQTFTLTNTGTNILSWSVSAPSLLGLSSMAGTLAPAEPSLTITVAVAGVVCNIPPGIYHDYIVFSNQVSGITQVRPVTFNIRGNDYLTENFENGGNDLAWQSLTFTPDNSPGGYSVCRSPATNFAPETLGGSTVSFAFEDYPVTWYIYSGPGFPFFGSNYTSFSLSENGCVTFGGFDRQSHETLAGHFSLPRISALWRNFEIPDGWSSFIYYKELSNRVAVTWQNVVEYGTTNRCSFQLEMFYDGRVRLTYLALGTTRGLVGISQGRGVPTDFTHSDFTAYGPCLPELKLTGPASASEGAGILAGQGRVSIPQASVNDLLIQLASSDPGVVLVPPTVLLPAGQTNIQFDLTLLDNGQYNGTRIIRITAGAENYRGSSGAMTVYDNEAATLAVNLPTTFREGDGVLTGQGRVSVSPAPDRDIVVTLRSGNTNELIVPEPGWAVIPAGQTSAWFSVSVIDDNRIDGPQTASITAHVENWSDGTGSTTVLDNESLQLTLWLPFECTEGVGIIAGAGTVSLAGTLPTNLVVMLTSSDLSELSVPASITIPAGQLSATFDLTVVDDPETDGAQPVTVTIAAIGFGSGTATTTVHDNEAPATSYKPSPPDLASNLPSVVRLTWCSEGEQIINGNFETGDFTGWTRENSGLGDFVINSGSFDPESSDGPLPPFLGSFSALAQQGGTGRHAIYQEVMIPSGATFVQLCWADRIRNHGADFASNHQFSVEIRNAKNQVLAVPFVTAPGAPLLNDWTQRCVDLGMFRGQTVRVAFVEQDSQGYLNVHLDNVSLQVGSPGPQIFDVYFGTNNELGAANLAGSTTNTHWDLPSLDFNTTYTWQVVARRGPTAVPGPVWRFSTLTTFSPMSLVPTGSIWKYLDNGTNFIFRPWQSAAFSDSNWLSGRAELGFGDASEGRPEATLLRSNRTDNSRIMTYYFRKVFVVTNLASIHRLTLRMLRDDGGVVYLNSNEVYRSNMYPGPPNYTTPAITNVGGADEATFYATNLSASFLVEGTNLLAVEIHQYSTTSTDLSFDCELNALVAGGTNHPPTVNISAPANFSFYSTPTNIAVTATAQDLDGSVNKVEFYADSVKLGEDVTPPYSVTWANPAPGTRVLTAIATDDLGASRKSAPVTVVVGRRDGTPITLIPKRSRWLYLDNGTDQGSTWRAPDFDDSTWPGGEAQLGYGDGDETTVVSYGPEATNKYITTYFRCAFTNQAVFSSLSITVQRDDGAIVYLNNAEVFRSNMSNGPVAYHTRASNTVNGVDELSFFANTNTPASSARLGRNVLAVEVHQDNPNSPDLSFDLTLSGIGNYLPTVQWTAPPDQAQFWAGRPILMAAEASDTYGTIRQVDFYQGNTRLGATTTAPYTFTWSNPPLGNFALRAVATDNQGGTNQSAIINVRVLALPRLEPRVFGAELVLAWSDSASGYVLEASTNLGPAALWAPVTNAVAVIDGECQVTLDLAAQRRFFRLRGAQ